MERSAQRTAHDWIFLKLYLGKAVDRIDRFLIHLGRSVAGISGGPDWFFIRYVDENGIHVRLRVKPGDGQAETLRLELIRTCAQRLSSLHELPAGDYFPMVSAPGFENAIEQMTAAHDDVKVIEAHYEPELDKYGGEAGIAIAEELFHASSAIAWAILVDEEHGSYSRKDLIPVLMAEVFRALLSEAQEEVFWREYCYYWLGGKSPAADDWREKFYNKHRQLQEAQIAITLGDDALPVPAREHVSRWRAALLSTAARYRSLRNAAEVNLEVLAFNFAHLMNNRLGLAALEEAYMATLLEKCAALRSAC